MILELLMIIGLSIAFAGGAGILYVLRYFRRVHREPEVFRNSHTILLILLASLVLHTLYLLASVYTAPIRHLLEILSVILFLAAIGYAFRQALWLEVASEVRKEAKVRELMEMRKLQERLEDAARELAETKSFFNSIIESSADAIIAADRDKKVTYFSRGAEEIFERRAEEVLGTNVLELYPREIRGGEERRKRAEELRKKGRTRLVTHIHTPKGKTKVVSLSLSLLKDSSGRVKGTVGVAKDITREVKAAEEIEYLKELSEKVIEGAPEGMLLLDLDFKVKMLNQGFERLTGVSREEVLGKKILELHKNHLLESFLEAMRLKQKFVEVAYEAKSLEPEEFTVEVSGEKKTFTDYWAPLLDSSGKVEHVLIIIQDITKRKMLEESLREQAAELKRSNELKDMFSDIMRHDLLNPIGVIKNYVELLSTEELNEEVRRALAAIARNVRKAVEMIESTARLAKIESEEEIKLEERDLFSMLAETVEAQESAAEKKRIEIVLEQRGKCPAMVSPFFEDVPANLISNAIKYSPAGSKVVAGIEDRDGSWRMYVRDNGPGVPDQFKESIFTRFERLKREGVRGTGLGLAIVKRVVELHKGRVWVEDNPEGGSVFYVEIPKGLPRKA